MATQAELAAQLTTATGALEGAIAKIKDALNKADPALETAVTGVVAKIAEKLGLREEYTRGKTHEEKRRLSFSASGVSDLKWINKGSVHGFSRWWRKAKP